VYFLTEALSREMRTRTQTMKVCNYLYVRHLSWKADVPLNYGKHDVLDSFQYSTPVFNM